MRSYLSPIVLVLALVLAACAPPPQEEAAPEAPSQAEVAAALHGLVDAYVSASNAGDATALTALFTDDAVLMPGNAPTASGKEAIQAFYQSRFDQFTLELAASQAEAEGAGEWAFARGTYTIKLTPKAGGEPIEYSGKYMNISKRQADGSWKMARHIWNSDKPPPDTGGE